MAEYIEREELVEWIKRIPLKDLSDGLGLCRVIMEEDFKRAIRTIPAGTPADAAPVVRCKECKHYKPEEYECGCDFAGGLPYVKADDYCSYGERKDYD